MIIQNKKTGQKFTTNMNEWENTIVAKGLANKYEIVEDDKPIEIRKLSVALVKKKEKETKKKD